MNPTARPEHPILIVDDEESILLSMDTILRMVGYNNIITCADSRRVMDLLQEHRAEVILSDLTMPHLDGLELLSAVTAEYPDIPVIIITVADDTDTAVQCIKSGAFDFLVKPLDAERLINTITKAEQMRNLQRENIALRDRILGDDVDRFEGFSEIITRNRRMQAIFTYVDAIAATSQPVLVTGETGVGKELISGILHKKSGRRGPFVTVNVAGLDDNVFSDTLFGHVKGAFTGADAPRKGLIEQASGGTLLLDEIGSLPLTSQVKLLRLLQESEYRPLGMDTPRKADVRIIASTNEDLDALQRGEKFRKDLVFRLQIHHIHIPPLRERPEDLPLLVAHFFEMASRELGRERIPYPRELVSLLQTYAFPGNVRELQAMIFDAASRHRKGILSLDVFEDYLARRREGRIGPMDGRAAAAREKIIFPETLPTVEEANRALFLEAMRRAGGNQSHAARLLGISQQAVNKRLKKMGQEPAAGSEPGS